MKKGSVVRPKNADAGVSSRKGSVRQKGPPPSKVSVKTAAPRTAEVAAGTSKVSTRQVQSTRQASTRQKQRQKASAASGKSSKVALHPATSQNKNEQDAKKPATKQKSSTVAAPKKTTSKASVTRQPSKVSQTTKKAPTAAAAQQAAASSSSNMLAVVSTVSQGPSQVKSVPTARSSATARSGSLNKAAILSAPASTASSTGGVQQARYEHLEVTPEMATRVQPSASNANAVVASTSVGDTTEDQLELAKEAYFHGLLPREDAQRMLRKQGDFLVRRTHIETNGGLTDVVSVMWTKKNYHFIIKRDRPGVVSVGDAIESNSLLGLINAYRSRDYHLSVKTGALLLNPVPRQDWELQHERITLKDKLGEGTFGEVFKGEMIPKEKGAPHIEVAVKKHFDTMSKDDIEVMMREARIMRQYRHPNIVRFLGVAVQQQPILLVMELVAGGALDKFLKKNKDNVDDEMRLQFCLDAGRGVKYLHSLKSIHRDISARNCLVDLALDNRLKISDFGLTKQGSTYRVTGRNKLPIRWLSPETLLKLDYSKKTDVWSYGVLVWEIYMNCEEEPYHTMSTKELQAAIKDGYRLPQPPLMDKLIKDMCDRCWREKPKERPAFYLIVNYLKDIQRSAPEPSLDKAKYHKLEKPIKQKKPPCPKQGPKKH